ncbi:MAG: PKD domain-containing protein, partial [Bacteroidia bacterium]|nr:PKD domain-containing protein [Bacteroidia bacterium]
MEMTLVVVSPPTINYPGTQGGCLIALFDLPNLHIHDGNTTITGYQWTLTRNGELVPDCFGTGATPPCNTYTEPGVYVLSLTVTNAYGSDTYTETFTVTVTPTASFSGPNIVVINQESGAEVTFTGTSTDATTFAWTIRPASGWQYVPPSNNGS